MLAFDANMFRGVLMFDAACLAKGVVRLALALLGRLLGCASEIQAEAAALGNELDEFFRCRCVSP